MKWLLKLAKQPAGRGLMRVLLRLNSWRYRPANDNNKSEECTMSDLQSIFSEMEKRFNAQAAAGVESVFQYEIDDSEHWFVAVEGGQCSVSQGQHDEPTVTLAMDVATLQDVLSGETDGMQAFMAGRIRADGNIMEATRLATLFPIS